jgi:hypothetical protein
VGQGSIGFGVAFDPQVDYWIKLRQDQRAVAHPIADFQAGLDEKFPAETYHFVLQNGMVRAYPVDPPQSPQANVSTPALLSQAYNLAQHVLLTPFEYAVFYEDGALVPASVTLIRENDAGQFLLTYCKAEDAQKQIQWFLTMDGTLYGMQLEGDQLVFYSEPQPPAAVLRSPEKPFLLH